MTGTAFIVRRGIDCLELKAGRATRLTKSDFELPQAATGVATAYRGAGAVVEEPAATNQDSEARCVGCRTGLTTWATPCRGNAGAANRARQLRCRRSSWA